MVIGSSADVYKFLTLFCNKGIHFVNPLRFGVLSFLVLSYRFGYCSLDGIFYCNQMENVSTAPRRIQSLQFVALLGLVYTT